MSYVSILFLIPSLVFGLSYSSKALKIKDYEEMKSLIQESILRSREKIPQDDSTAGVDEAISELKKSLKMVLMRPDTDHHMASLLLLLQNEVMNYRSFFPIFKELVQETLTEFKAGKNSLAYQVSLIYLIENSISYLKGIDQKESTQILTEIKTANLKISKEISNYFILEMGRGKPVSPSYLASRVLKTRLKTHKELLKAQQEAENKEKQKLADKNQNGKKRNPSSSIKSFDTKSKNTDTSKQKSSLTKKPSSESEKMIRIDL